MDDAEVVGDVERLGALDDHPRRPRERHGGRLVQQGGEALAVDQLHREVDQSLGRLTEVIDGADVRMADAARVRGLAIEAADGVRVAHRSGRHDLDGAAPAHLHMLGQVDLAHAAFAQLLGDVIALGDHLAHEVGAGRRLPERGAVADAEELVVAVFGAARRANPHPISARSIWSPTSRRAFGGTRRSPRTATATPFLLPASTSTKSASSLRTSACSALIEES